jgi:hypothetical protein
MQTQPLTYADLRERGIELVDREDGVYLVFRVGPFKTEADAMAAAPLHIPALQD